MDTVSDVAVTMLDGADAVCGQAGEVVTEVEFLQDFGSLPAALVRCVAFSPSGDRTACFLPRMLPTHPKVSFDLWLTCFGHVQFEIEA